MSWVSGLKITDGLLAGEVFQRIDTDMNMMSWSVYPDTEASVLKYVQGSGLRWQSIDIINMLRSQEAGSTVLYAGCDVETNESSPYIKAQMRWEIQKSGSCYVKLKYRGYTDDNNYIDTVISPIDLTIAPIDLERALAIYMFFTVSNYSGESMVFTGVNPCWVSPGAVNEYHVDGWTCSYFNFVTNVTQGTWEEEETSPEFGPASEPEGYDGGSFDYHSDVIDMPSKPQSVLSLGFVNVYKCAANALVDFGAALFPEIQWPTSLSDVGEVLAAFSDSVWNSKLIDYVVSVHCVPGDVAAGSLEDIKVGARTMTGIMGRKISDEYFDFDFGTLHTDAIYKNFVDQMCQAELYLPFYGFVSLKPEQWNGGDISVKYRINVIDGSFTAFVFSKPAKSEMTQPGLIGQYGGSCVVHLPVSSNSYASMFSGMIGGATQAALGVASGTMTTAVSGAMTVSGAVGGGMTGGDSKMSNSYNASSSFMTRRRPYLLVSAPIPSFSTRYNIECGLPTNQAMVLGTLTGLVKASNPILDGIPCTENEREKIRAALASGLIF